jgi:hypothetical protein
MRNAVIAVLGLLVLCLGAWNGRLRAREERLQERLALLEKQTPPKLVPLVPLPPTPVEPPSSAPHAPARAATPAPPSAKSVPAVETGRPPGFPMSSGEPNPLVDVIESPSLSVVMIGEGIQLQSFATVDLGLTDAQRILIDGYRKMGELESLIYKDKIREIEERTREAIRRSLDPEQLKKYDAPRTLAGTATFSVQLTK